MRVRAEAGLPIKKKTSILCAFCIEDTNVAIGLEKFNKKIDQTISQSLKEIKGKRARSQLFIHIKKSHQKEF